VKNRVEALGGRVRISNASGVGATLIAEVPRAAPQHVSA
jgi:chemotaxis protein histidine kinase CheA